MIRYPYNFNQEVNRLMGAYTFFLTNGQYERAFRNLYNATIHVIRDPKLRVFSAEKSSSGEQERDVKKFTSLAKLFRGFFFGPSPDGCLAYMDLRPRIKPNPEENRIFIGRNVRFFDVWGHYDYEYLVHTIGFANKIPSVNAAGFPIETIKPMFSFTNRNIMKLKTNCIPYVLWEQQVREVLKILMPLAKDLEHRMASFLHGDSASEGTENSADQKGSPVVQIAYQSGSTDAIGGYEYGPEPAGGSASPTDSEPLPESDSPDEEEFD